MIAATVSGNVGSDARLGQAGDTPVLNFSIASRRYANGEEVTDWVECSFWGSRATKVAGYVTKGKYVTVRGTIYVREYEHNGQKKFGLTCRADDLELGSGGKETSATPRPALASGPVEKLPF